MTDKQIIVEGLEKAIHDLELAARTLRDLYQVASKKKDFPLAGSLDHYANAIAEILACDDGHAGLYVLFQSKH